MAERQVETTAEIGVYGGKFAEAMLGGCPGITTYDLVDPWRHLEDWNKPANKADNRFQIYFRKDHGAHGAVGGQARTGDAEVDLPTMLEGAERVGTL
jgi:hypothetical protein